ncbi:MAG: TlpA family protein disulfide reductase [Cyclonatronaceae bacterium]
MHQALGYLHLLESLKIGQDAPDFQARTIVGDDVSLSDLRGNVVLLEFWATWCGPCLPEIPKLYNVAGIPRLYLIGPDGKIIARDLRGEQMIEKTGSFMTQ